MESLQYEYKLLRSLGSILDVNAKPLDKLKAYLTNAIIIVFVIFGSVAPVILYMKDHREDAASFIVAAYQIPGFSCPLLIYIILLFKKIEIREILMEIETIIKRRMKIRNNGSYEKAIKTANIFVKFPIDFLFGMFNVNDGFSLIKCIIGDLIKGEIIIENWYLPYKSA